MNAIKIIAEMMGYEAFEDTEDNVYIYMDNSSRRTGHAFDPSNDAGLRDRCLEALHVNVFYITDGWRASARGEPITVGGITPIIVCDAKGRTLAIMKCLFELAERRKEFINL